MIYKTKKELEAVEGPMTTISLRMPKALVEELKALAPRLGFSGYQPLLRAYASQGLQADKERLANSTEFSALLNSLRNRGVSDTVIGSALAESQAVYQVTPASKLATASSSVRSEKDLSWLAFVAATYGSFADDPIERPTQGYPDTRETLN